MTKFRALTTAAIALAVAAVFYAVIYWKTAASGSGDPNIFLSAENVSNILGQASVVGILACGMTLVIVSGQIDLSVGSMLGMLGAIAATLVSREIGPGLPGIAAAALVILLGAALGAAQGSLVAYLKIPSFVVTLGGLMAYRGVLLLVAASTIPVASAFINGLGQAALPIGSFLLPVRFAAMALLAVATSIVASRMKFGRYLYAIGGNAEAARYSGIRVSAHVVGAFAIMGAVAGFAGLVSAGIQMAADAGAGDLLELYAIAACVIGGTSLSGGKGNVLGSVLGALLMAIIRNGLSLLGVTSAGEKIVLGLLLVFAVTLDTLFNRRRSIH
jgi:ribose transport system permease protein